VTTKEEAMNETPLIFTSKGNVPIDSLRYEHEWIDSPEMLIFHERWFDGSELVKNNAHAYAKQALTIGGEQAAMA
jgi:hypothetical protein